MLEQSDIAHYLLSLGLVKSRSVLEEDLTILDASRRNSVFLATTRAGPTYVVKQATPRTAAALDHEAAVLRTLAGAPELAGRVPTVVRHEPEAALLVLSSPGGGRDWVDHHGSGRFPRIPARALGGLLGALHRMPTDAVADTHPLWALSLPAPPRALLLDLSAGAQDVLARLQASDELCGRLDELAAAGGDVAFVHGDVRWDNCLAIASPGSRRRTRVLLIDWELAGAGDASSDVGTALAEYLRLWVGSIPIADPADPSRLLAYARHPLARMQPAIEAFWNAYARANRGHPPLRRVIELTAVRLLQSAVERAQGLVSASAHVVTLVQLADNMLRDPDAAARGLLGLRA